MLPGHVCSVCAGGQLDGLLEVVAAHLGAHPEARALVVVADGEVGAGAAAPDRVELRAARDLDVPGLGLLRAAHDAGALRLALLPFALRALGEPALAVPADAAAVPVFGELDAGAGALLVPRRAPGRVAEPDALALLAPDTPLLAWWCDRVAAFAEPEGLLDEALGVVEGVVLDVHAALPARRDSGAAAPARLPGGAPLTPLLRELFRTGAAAGELTEDPFTPVGAALFAQWLRDPHPDITAGGVSRLAFEIRRRRPDLQIAYPDVRAEEGRAGLTEWLAVRGSVEYDLPAHMLPEAPPPPGPPGDRVPWGVNVAGYFTSDVGVGEIARRVVAALDSARVPLLPVQGSLAPPTTKGTSFTALDAAAAPFAVNLVCVNADGLPEFARDVGHRFFAGRHTIGLWWWELPDLPEPYRGAFEWLDELWVGSRWAQEHLAAVSPVPVVRMPAPVLVPDDAPPPRAELGLPEGPLLLFMFDFNSTVARKNPEGAIEAFRRAFPAPGEASLLVKSINGHRHPRALARVRAAAAGRPDVHVLDGVLPAVRRDALVASADAYVSLHRSEGFGLTIAEAMALGKPVVATGWSGNMDFTTPDNAWLVPHRLVEVGAGAEPYPADGVWAEPDLDAAAAALREVVAGGEAVRARAERGRRHVLREHSVAACGTAMAERLDLLRARIVTDQGDRSLALARRHADEVRTRGAAAAAAGAAAGGTLRRAARAAVQRVGRPLVEEGRRADAVLVDELESVQAELERLRAEHGALMAGVLGAQRAADAHLAGLDAGQDELRRRAADDAPAIDDARWLAAGARAQPYAADEPFAARAHPLAGRVLALRAARSVGSGDAYRSFEDHFRGPRERVAELLRPYVPLLRDSAPVLDVGCGRGELIELLAGAGIEARGVDADAGMAAVARAAGVEVEVDDGVAHLERLEPGALGAVTAMHVVEHLPLPALQRLLAAARRALREGGLLVFETVNPHAPHALKTFWVDLTHQHPVFPEVALVLAGDAGFRDAFLWHPRGSGDVAADRFAQDSYAIVATA